MQTEWKSVWNRGGKFKQLSWIDKDVIVWCSGGSHLVFFHLKKKHMTSWRCPGSIDGVSLISSYPQLHLLAFSECCFNPRILILTYPNLKSISECTGGTENSYLATVFAPPDFMVTLASSPDYNLILWSWRTGHQLSSIATPIHDSQGQMIRVSRGKPAFIAQLGGVSGKLIIWQITRSSISPLYEQVILPKKAAPMDVDWSPDTSDSYLAIIDDSGHVYMCNKNGGQLNRIIFSQRCSTCLDYEAPALRWFNDGILLKTTFCQMRFYRKNQDVWRRQWFIKTLLKPYILAADPFRKNQSIFVTAQGDVMRMTSAVDEAFPKVEKMLNYGGDFKFLDLIYPWGHHLVAIDNLKNIVIMQCHNGEEIGKLNLPVEGEIVNLTSHLDYPIIAVSTFAGELCLVTAHVFQYPKILRKYRLDKYNMDIVKFSQCGRYLITARKRYGVVHCLESIENTFSRIRKIETAHRILDVSIFNANGGLTIIMLILPFKRAKAGNCMIIYKLLADENDIGGAVSVIKLPFLYDNLHYGLDPMTMTAAPFSSRQLHSYRVHDSEINMTNAMQSAHKIRGIKVDTNRDWIVTYGFDGIIGIIKNFNTLQLVTSVNSHHRLNFGVSKAVLKPFGDLMISLGSDGSLVGMKLWRSEIQVIKQSKSLVEFDDDYSMDESKMTEISMDYSQLNDEIIEMLSQSYEAIPPENSGVEIWGDWMIKQQETREEEEFRSIKLSIIGDFDKMKKQVSKLLDENEKLDVNERIPIAAFDLDMIEREQKIKTAKEERENQRLELEFKCAQVEKVSNWIKKRFWDVQQVKQQSIFTIFGDTEVMNFPSVPQDPQAIEMPRWLEFWSEINDNCDFNTEEPKATLLRNQYSPIIEEEKTIMESVFEDDDDEVAKKEKIEEIQAAAGITTFRFIEPTSQYCQFQHYTFPELLNINNALLTDAQTLKNYFNKLFNEIFTLKERAMSSSIQIISHIRFIDSELRLMFNSSVPEIPIEPQWAPNERPESLITVTDDEVPVKPYVSPSEQNILDKQADEQERIRQLMLSDDFRRRALIAMMDGVLEYRWEDIIKKDIPQPEFMLTKNPEDYTKEEIIIVQNYEKQVVDLGLERDRYKGFLETTYSKIMKTLRETIDKFNTNLQGLFLTRMKVQSAIFQLDLLTGRWYLHAFERMKSFKEAKKIQAIISEQELKMENIVSCNKIIDEELGKLKSQREILHNKEKGVKKFRCEFQSLGKMTVEILKKQYTKRPKVVLKNASSGEVLTLGKCIATRNTSVPLPSEYKNYLASLEILDIQPEDLPESVNSNHWDHLVKIRRHQIELEMKLKANLLEITEIEKNLMENNTRIGRCKEMAANSNDSLGEMNRKQSECIKDMEIQLVLRMGQVEIGLNGLRIDTQNSSLIPVEIVKRMNIEILKAGDGKLQAMEEMIKFQRGTLHKEWEHKTLQMEMQELKEEFNEINNILVTKQMRTILRKHQTGNSESKSPQDLAREIAAIEMSREKSLNDWVVKIESIEKQIVEKKRENEEFDGKITEMNVNRWEMELKRNLEAEKQSNDINEATMKMILQRAKLCRKIHKIYTDKMALKIESQLLRMKQYPTLPGCEVIHINNTDAHK